MTSNRLRGLQGAAVDEHVAQIGSRDVLHDHVIGVVVLGPPVVNRNDVRVRQPGGSTRLRLEALDEIGIRREGRLQDLHRDGAVEQQVVAAIDLAHPAARYRATMRYR